MASFRPLIKITNTSIDLKFVLALLERWKPENHTFHLPTGECTITLEDVYMLLGLPIVGKAVNGCVQQANALCKQALSVDLIEGEVGARGQGVNLKALKLYYYQFNLYENSSKEIVLQKTRYKWGSAVLEMLYQSLCKNAKRDSCTFYGCAVLILRKGKGLQEKSAVKYHDFIWRPYLDCEHELRAEDAAIWTTKTSIFRYDIVEMHQSDRVKL
ncbi:serine/threonine-protein phosphatase 7 long form homolog [Vicia villosa]|uniref:serine/threonine-protein phosphatase 7 long form homolog n=1 Tax=Vicia villosa TaxID=3911 RepID=UPI00273B67D7|nr:serine/threonine-protein phosphatase 7 long form homolog [Vicia villosa]